jgi:carbonic anhydrase/acetyltransferase-like protein (isoleucine patch superfamily)
MIRSFAKDKPSIHGTAFIHETAEIIGRATIGPRVSIWPYAVVRADVCPIHIGEASNLQDGVLVHGREKYPTVIGKGVTIGHGAIIHGATIGDLCLIGMGAIVMEAVIGRECVIAAGALLPKGAVIPPKSLVIGMPGKVARSLNAEELRFLRQSRDNYLKLAKVHNLSSRVASR